MLAEEDLAKLRGTLHTSGWTDVIAPRLVKRGREALRELKLLPSERSGSLTGLKDGVASAFLKGRIAEIEWMLAAWDNEMQVADYNRRRDELDGVQAAPPANPEMLARSPR